MKYTFYLLIGLLFFACVEEEGGELASVDERKKEAIEELADELTAPPFGWKLHYRPTPTSGSYFMILNFNTDGSVNIKSDIVDNDREFIDHTIFYRIDAALGLELILETYGVFHYLFEKDQATFGAEFEFLFLEQDGDNLLFQSLSDFSNPTLLEFSPAAASDVDLFSYELSENLASYDSLSPQIFGGLAPIQQVVLEDKGISVFWSIDIIRRTIDLDMAAVGTTIEEIEINDNKKMISHTTGYTLLNGAIVLDQGFTFSLNGESLTIDEVALTNFSIVTENFCSLESSQVPQYTGSISGIGPVTVKKSLFDSDGLGFQPTEDFPYSVTAFFAFDDKGYSLLDNGIIGEKFPTTTAILFNYGFVFEDEPTHAFGFNLDDANGETLTYLRELEVTERVGNRIKVTFLDSYYFSDTPPADAQQSMQEITDLIFEGGDMYIFQYPVNNLTVYWLFNPCNKYEVFLVG